MIRYCIIGTSAVLVDRTPASPREGRLTITVPDGATLLWNGHVYPAPAGRVKLPLARMQETNLVKLRYRGVTYPCEGLVWDGQRLTPVGCDTEALLLSAVDALARQEARISALEATVARLVAEVETPLFL